MCLYFIIFTYSRLSHHAQDGNWRLRFSYVNMESTKKWNSKSYKIVFLNCGLRNHFNNNLKQYLIWYFIYDFFCSFKNLHHLNVAIFLKIYIWHTHYSYSLYFACGVYSFFISTFLLFILLHKQTDIKVCLSSGNIARRNIFSYHIY